MNYSSKKLQTLLQEQELVVANLKASLQEQELVVTNLKAEIVKRLDFEKMKSEATKLQTILELNLNFKTKFYDDVLNELKQDVKTKPTLDVLDKLNKLRVKYMNDYPTPTTHHMETIELSQIFTDIISTFISKPLGKEFEQWWQDAQANTKRTEYDYSYSSVVWTPK